MRCYDRPVYLLNGSSLMDAEEYEHSASDWSEGKREKARSGSMAYANIMKHNVSQSRTDLKLKVDVLVSDDPTYVAILQTARASGLKRFPVPYILSNHVNTLHAVGGTINSDDHLFGLSAARKYGGIYLPPHAGNMHQYIKETIASPDKMILGSDSHTRYGALGTMGIGEGGGEVVKLLLDDSYDIRMPEIVAVYLEGKPRPGVGPHDVALAFIRKVFQSGFVKNRALEFVGPGIANLSMDFRLGIDVMSVEAGCWSTIWATDEKTRAYMKIHGREEDYQEIQPAEVTLYDRAVRIDLEEIHPMIAVPFHPSNGYEIREFNENAEDILHTVEEDALKLAGARAEGLKLREKIQNGRLHIDQAVIGGCAGGLFENIMAAAEILEQGSWDYARLQYTIYPSSQPILEELIRNGTSQRLLQSGAILKTPFCGACMGNGDIPGNGCLSVRHMPRNFMDREGSQAAEGQMAAVALMDCRSIAATVIHNGALTSAEELEGIERLPDSYEYRHDTTLYEKLVKNYWMAAEPETELTFGPNIRDWPEMEPLKDKLLLQVCTMLMDEVTSTDELSPSRAAPYRANPERMASLTLSGRDPEYVGRTRHTEALRVAKNAAADASELPEELTALLKRVEQIEAERWGETRTVPFEEVEVGSVLYAKRPGDGSSREQAASGQRVLGGVANIAIEYATKRYRSNMVNWGMLPFQMAEEPCFETGDWIYIPNVYAIFESGEEGITAWVIGDHIRKIHLTMLPVTDKEAEIIRAGSLINYNRDRLAGCRN